MMELFIVENFVDDLMFKILLECENLKSKKKKVHQLELEE
jgi:hypothetical protein